MREQNLVFNSTGKGTVTLMAEVEAWHIQPKYTFFFFLVTAVNHCGGLPKIMNMFKTRMDVFLQRYSSSKKKEMKKSLALYSIGGQIIYSWRFILTSRSIQLCNIRQCNSHGKDFLFYNGNKVFLWVLWMQSKSIMTSGYIYSGHKYWILQCFLKQVN